MTVSSELADVRSYVDTAVLEPGAFELPKEEAHHLVSVRRKRVGDRVTLLNGKGLLAHARIAEISGRRAVLEIESVVSAPEPEVPITLVMANLKPAALEVVFQKAVELGAARIVLVQSEHAVAQVKADRREKKLERWNQLLSGACKQSGNPWLPELCVAGSCSDARDQLPEACTSFAAMLSEASEPLLDAFQAASPEQVALWVGPEGDFSDAEKQLLEDGGVVPVSLGARIQRAETAALSMLAVAAAVWDC